VTSLRSGLKRAIETALVASGGAALARRSRSNRVLILAYHDIIPDGFEAIGDRSLHLRQRSFASQLDRLGETHDVVPLAVGLDALSLSANTSGRPRAAITFDDAYSGALTAGVEELRVRGLPATVFVTPSFLGGGTFWWDTFADPVNGLDANLRRQALLDARGLNSEVEAIASISQFTKCAMPSFACGASMQELQTALEYSHITLAAHTWSHPNLVALPDTMLATELARPLEWLQQFGDRALPMVSYPYGLADIRVQEAARKSGYEAGFMIDGGWSSAPPPDPFAIPRLNVPAGVSRDGFVLRAAGLIQG